MEWRNLVTTRMQKREETQWRKSMNFKSKLRTYRRIKDKLHLEPYLQFEQRGVRCLLTCLRSGTNFLRIETGRYEGEKPEDRLCYHSVWDDAVPGSPPPVIPMCPCARLFEKLIFIRKKKRPFFCRRCAALFIKVEIMGPIGKIVFPMETSKTLSGGPSALPNPLIF